MPSADTKDSKKEADVPAVSKDDPTPPPLSPQDSLLVLLRHNLALIQRSVAHLEPRFTARALRTLTTVRRKVVEHPSVLALALNEALGTEEVKPLAKFLPAPYAPSIKDDKLSDAMDVDVTDKDEKKDETTALPTTPVTVPFKPTPEAKAELEAYAALLTIVFLVDSGKAEESLVLARNALNTVTAQNRRSLDQLGARLVFYLSRSLELQAKAGKGSGLASERPFLLALHRTSSLRHDDETCATVINLLLRSYIGEANLYEQADKLVARAPFPRSKAPNGQIARYEYYVGRVRAVQLNYSEAHTHLQQAIRRAPAPALANSAAPGANKAAAQAAATAPGRGGASTAPAAGFLQTAHKFLIVVELLMGDIPERGMFRNEVLKRALAPYMEIVQAVRVGDLSLFQRTLQTHDALFVQDRTRSLILRLRHNVIKTGIRTISLAYSRISLHDITQKLHLESEEDAEYIVAKAVRDGVIEARVDHERGEMRSQETGEVYATNEPQVQFRQRVNFCLQLHNESVKAMRYPLNNHKAELASAVAAREREREIASEIADGEIDEDDEDWV